MIRVPASHLDDIEAALRDAAVAARNLDGAPVVLPTLDGESVRRAVLAALFIATGQHVIDGR